MTSPVKMSQLKPMNETPLAVVLLRGAMIQATVTEAGASPDDTDIDTARDTILSEIEAGTVTKVNPAAFGVAKQIAIDTYKRIFVETENGYDFDRSMYGVVLPSVTIT